MAPRRGDSLGLSCVQKMSVNKRAGCVLRAGSSKVQVAALRGWTLLLSAMPAWQLTAPEVERHLANLAQQLQVLHRRGRCINNLQQTFHAYQVIWSKCCWPWF